MFNFSIIFFLLLLSIIILCSLESINSFIFLAINIEIFWIILFTMTQAMLLINDNAMCSVLSLILLVVATAELLIVMVFMTSQKNKCLN